LRLKMQAGGNAEPAQDKLRPLLSQMHDGALSEAVSLLNLSTT